MFTGLIEEVGTVVGERKDNPGKQLRPQVASRRNLSVLQIAARHTAKELHAGDSVAVNGCCLTLSSKHANELTFDLLEETIACTNLKNLRGNDRVNLERALPADGRLGGHFVQGHIDCVSPIVAFDKKGADFRLEVELPDEFAQYVTRKGSIAVNGISLTVAELLSKSFVVWIVPYTKSHTNLKHARVGDLVNLEFDILAKYVERMLPKDNH